MKSWRRWASDDTAPTEHFRNARTGIEWAANVGAPDHTHVFANLGEFERITPPKRTSTRKPSAKTAKHDQDNEG
ncbi:hypothetical protein SAMN05421805_1011505 [Saccharopolyspora antimicrobica]|uniref:Uncharacterized protein n=1 Tax=Saccharopolyspora antimicrobica TaxID=455193 RepID=A0A1I4TNQ8_9PSEU|nr:hypothetical protein [Saccharopolyspora antimicrobica]RKT88485.1 hypothetical protein ATL45_6919 [Saccharopolyspora antimicrobica]SFM78261.1 hypothetical protein SAMN05421805_1011505 [Saccharopolyspora antimicrobica]